METKFEHNIKLDNHVITKLLEQNDKRALFIYTYALRWNIERLCVPTPISFILELLGKKPVAANIKSVRNSLKILVEMKLIKVYSEITLKNEADIDSLNKNDFMYIVAEESLSEDNYTLLKAEYVDMTMINASELEREDMMAIVLLLSRNIERRDEVLQICWHSTDKLTKELKIRKARLFQLINGLKELEVIYFEKLTFEFGEGKKKEHLIYSMFGDSEQVKMAVKTAKAYGKLDARAKCAIKHDDYDIIVPLYDDEIEEMFYAHRFAKDEDVYNLLIHIYFNGEILGDTTYELNARSVGVVNNVYKEFGKDILVQALDAIGFKASGADNPTGYLISRLPDIAREFSQKAS
ncbi:hypothetical protein DN390_12490 [Bacillus sp. SH7-1]|uniref:hypothetical protein n=1 Tax=Bacillus sp. SH7-1 TaxID=2217818 RepID=UPI000BEBA222|nr:hypothetical protein [Bacillus sp. SH7-1]PEE15330.1 hypothetical protein CON53_25710 [Bacillus cereus]TXR99530.1 hypothetical protein DN390_12490 [Bacillus sp. SH7-1]